MTDTVPGWGYGPAGQLPRRRLPDRRLDAGRGQFQGVPPQPPEPPRRRRRGRGLGALAWLFVLFGLFATGLGLSQLSGPGLPHLFGDPGSGPKSAALSRSVPTRLTISSIQVTATVRPVGLAADGTIGVPALTEKNTVGWYDQGPTPGQDGPAVLVGHVDTRAGPSVFAKLGKLKQGDKILVSRKDHRLAIFRVDAVRAYPKTNVPANEVYGDFSHPGLRLITCGGRWLGGSVGYADNIVVYASLVQT